MGHTWILAVPGDTTGNRVAGAGKRDALSLSTLSKEHRGERETPPQNSGRMCSWSCQHPILLQRARPLHVPGSPNRLPPCTASPCRGVVSKNNSMLSPKLLLCLLLCHELHVTSHSRESSHSAMLGYPDEATKTDLQRHRVLPGLSNVQATYLLPAEPAVPIESFHLSGLSGSGLLKHLPGAEPFSRLGQRGSTDVSKLREKAQGRKKVPPPGGGT